MSDQKHLCKIYTLIHCMTKIGGLLYFYNFRNIRFEDRMCNYIYVSKDSFYFIIEIELIIESKF